jgi:hypothetical protein
MNTHFTDAKKVFGYSEFEIFRVEYSDGTYTLHHFINQVNTDTRVFYEYLNNLFNFLVYGDWKMQSRLYPNEVSNLNVPKDVYLVADLVYTSGENHDTYYIDRYGNILIVGDWNGDLPSPVSLHRLTEITGDTEQTIKSRYKSYFYWKDKGL